MTILVSRDRRLALAGRLAADGALALGGVCKPALETDLASRGFGAAGTGALVEQMGASTLIERQSAGFLAASTPMDVRMLLERGGRAS